MREVVEFKGREAGCVSEASKERGKARGTIEKRMYEKIAKDKSRQTEH